MEEKILNEILKETFTLDSLKKRVQVLKLKLERQIYGGAEEVVSGLEKREEKWLSGFDKKLIIGMTSDMYSSFTKRIDAFINSTQPMTIYFVFMPDGEQIKGVGKWLRENLNQPGMVFDFKVDPTLIGGCAFVYKGVYKDYSLRAKISDEKEQIIGEFRKYFRQ